MRYWDASTLAKLYCSEPDSSLFIRHMQAAGEAVSSELVRWELFRVFVRKEADGMIGAGQAEVVFQRFLTDVQDGTLSLIPWSPLEDRFRHTVTRLHRHEPPPCWPARWTASTSPRP
jgi:hypothetical protein